MFIFILLLRFNFIDSLTKIDYNANKNMYTKLKKIQVWDDDIDWDDWYLQLWLLDLV